MIADSDLNPCEKLIRHGAIVGVEEDFVLPYRLPKPVDINGTVHTHVYIVGSVDLHLAIKSKNVVHHYVIDWKSGNKVLILRSWKRIYSILYIRFTSIENMVEFCQI